jgi:hypothetical protein
MSNTARHLFLPWPRSVQDRHSQMNSLGSILTWSLHVRLSLASVLFPSCFPTTTLCAPSSAHACYMPCPSHSCWLDFPDNILWEVTFMKLLTVQQLPLLYCYFAPPPPAPNIFLGTLSPRFYSLWETHPYKSRDIVIVIYVQVIIFGKRTGIQKMYWMLTVQTHGCTHNYIYRKYNGDTIFSTRAVKQ